MTDREHEQARLYMMSQGYDIDPEELRKLL
jgi:hypothetical protein